MVEATVTAAEVTIGTTPKIVQGIFGATVTQGKAVYKDEDDSKWKLAQCDGTAEEAGRGGIGVALNSGVDGQPAQIRVGGGVFDPGFNPTESIIYVVGTTAGAMMPSADLASTNYCTVLYVGDGDGMVHPIFKYTGTQKV